MVDKLYHRANPYSSFRPTVRFLVEIQHYVCDCATPREIMVQRHFYAHVWRFRILHITAKSIKWTWAELFEMNVKFEQELNFVVDNDS